MQTSYDDIQEDLKELTESAYGLLENLGIKFEGYPSVEYNPAIAYGSRPAFYDPNQNKLMVSSNPEEMTSTENIFLTVEIAREMLEKIGSSSPNLNWSRDPLEEYREILNDMDCNLRESTEVAQDIERMGYEELQRKYLMMQNMERVRSIFEIASEEYEKWDNLKESAFEPLYELVSDLEKRYAGMEESELEGHDFEFHELSDFIGGIEAGRRGMAEEVKKSYKPLDYWADVLEIEEERVEDSIDRLLENWQIVETAENNKEETIEHLEKAIEKEIESVRQEETPELMALAELIDPAANGRLDYIVEWGVGEFFERIDDRVSDETEERLINFLERYQKSDSEEPQDRLRDMVS